MTDDAIIAEAIARRDAALLEAQRWDDFIARYRELTAARPVGRLRQGMVAGVVQGALQGVMEAALYGRATETGRLSETENLAISIIKEKRRPVPTREMLDEMIARGFPVGGQDPVSTLSARLSRAPSLENIRPHGWRLREPQNEIGVAERTFHGSPANSDPEPNSDPVEPVVGGGT